ncbi:MAG: pyridoxal kinase [Alphaproteobacteria bacterium]|nr:pyridoxal kinase [Alphaproteobacteria bacterium]
MAILSIQSRVTSGYVGNAAAVPILQRLGHTVWPIDTVAFSNHPAHGAYRGDKRRAEEISSLVQGLDERNLLPQCDALLTGYLGSAAAGPTVLDAAMRARLANPDAIWCCDPVMGDNGAFYVEDGIPAFFQNVALPAADMILPNAFEAAYLSGLPIDTIDDAIRSANALLDKGPKTVVLTGLQNEGSVGALVAQAGDVWRCMATPIDVTAHGAGDVFAALFVGRYVRSHNAADALGFATAGVRSILQMTADRHAVDLRLIDALPALDGLSALPVEKVG